MDTPSSRRAAAQQACEEPSKEQVGQGVRTSASPSGLALKALSPYPRLTTRRAAQSAPRDDDGPTLPAAKRFDGTGYRETMWDITKGSGEVVKPGADGWLQEKDLEMLSKGGPSETGTRALWG